MIPRFFYFEIPSTVTDVSALAAYPFDVAAFRYYDVEIRCFERVTSFAMGLRVFTPLLMPIVCCGHEFVMGRVAAQFVATSMVDRQVVRYWGDK